MTTLQSIRAEIAREREEREASNPDLITQVDHGAGREGVKHLLFFTSPEALSLRLEAVRSEVTAGLTAADPSVQVRRLRFLVELALGLRSFVPRWNLQDRQRHGDSALDDHDINVSADQLCALAVELSAKIPAVTEELLAMLLQRSTRRFETEGAQDPEVEARALIGDSLGDYVSNRSREVQSSQLRRIAEMRAAGQTRTELSNDYAAFLQHALYIGASFATCNPPLVDRAWVIAPERWDPVVEGIIADNPEADGDTLARWVTLEIVLHNMRQLRPIFLLTTGEMGCVCLQVNPHLHGDQKAMISDARFFHRALKARLDDGVPNVVFKLPGTEAGLAAARILTQEGIGVTITVDFGMFQHVPFAQVLAQGTAPFSCLVEMNGRLAFPVRDELLGKLDELSAHGIDGVQARRAAAWAGVAVVKRLHRLLVEQGYDLSRVKPLIASLRIYDGPGYEDLPSPFPDITETIGASIISVFPDIRRAFDRGPAVEMHPRQIESPVPEDVMQVLAHSEIFRQAYYVADRGWVSDEQRAFEPRQELALDDRQATAAWLPVQATLAQFCDSYDVFVRRILEHKERITGAR